MVDALVACSQKVLLLEKGNTRTIHAGHGIYYGITWDEERVYVASRGWPNGQFVLVFDSSLSFLGALPTGELLSIHQIFWHGGRLYIANTGANRLEVWGGGESWVWDYNGAGRDLDHLNSVWSDGAFVYVGEHRWMKPSRVQIFDMDLEPVRTVEGAGRELHNVYREGSNLYVCSSGDDALLALDLATGERRSVDLGRYHGGYARGLARVEDRWYVGMSAKARRGERETPGPSAVLVLDDDFNLVDRLDMNTGQILEIRALEGDRAHNGIPFPKGGSR